MLSQYVFLKRTNKIRECCKAQIRKSFFSLSFSLYFSNETNVNFLKIKKPKNGDNSSAFCISIIINVTRTQRKIYLLTR